jgi:hypothetical protein
MTTAKKVQMLTYVLGAFFILAGTPKAIGLEMAATKFAGWGFPTWFMRFVGVCEWACGVGMLTKFRMPAAFATMLIMIGAIATHVANSEFVMAPLPLVLAGLCFFVVRTEMTTHTTTAHTTTDYTSTPERKMGMR